MVISALALLAISATMRTPEVATPNLAVNKVEFKRTGARWQLLRDGKPYFVKGVGGTTRMDDLLKAGGNSMRTWGADNLEKELKDAHAKGITVCAGIWLGHKSYFDYANPKQVKEQYETVRQVVTKHKGHPALLFWALGNEMEMNNDTPELWTAINDLAKLVKSIDPDRPVITVVAELGGNKIANIKRYAPELDAIGVNTYGGMPTMGKRLRDLGWDKPFLATEFGPLGPWERPRTAWGAPHEQTSTEKAAFYRLGYEGSVLGAPDQCVGSYAFLWGDKQEQTPTWFGMYLPTGERTEAVDVMQELWTGKYPANRAPRIDRISSSIADQEIEPSSMQAATVEALDPNGDTLDYRWEIRSEVGERKHDGIGEARPEVLNGLVAKVHNRTVRFVAPKVPGAYRLYAYVTDGKGSAATANICFRVKG